MFAQHFIDNLDFARNGVELRGEIAVAEMPRLQDLLATPEGKVEFVLRGLLDNNGKAVLELALNGLCQLRCQRCLQSLPYPINTVSRLMPVAETELAETEPDVDELDYIPADTHMNVQDMIEEEILLGLPFAPKHEPGTCQAAMEISSRSDENPFAILRGMKNE